MSRVHRVHNCLALLLMVAGILFFVPAASAQMSKEEKQRVITMLSAQIDRAITAHETEGVALREKVIGRLFICGGLFVMMSKHMQDPQAKNASSDAAEISLELSPLVSKGVGLSRFKEIGDAAQKSLTDKLAAKRTPESEREMQVLLLNCRSFHSLADVSDAVAELQTTSARRDASSIQFAKELQECSLYYLLLAGGTITQVPNSGRLSPADSEKGGAGDGVHDQVRTNTSGLQPIGASGRDDRCSVEGSR